MLTEDHKAVERLFKRFEKTGDRAHAEKRKLVTASSRACRGTPRSRSRSSTLLRGPPFRARRTTCWRAWRSTTSSSGCCPSSTAWIPAEERFDAKMTVLIENVRHHVEEEEQEFFPKVRAELDRKALAEVGQAMEAAKEMAPSHPHPRSPDTPPGNLAAAGGAGMVDRISDTVSGVAQGSVTAVQDLVAAILGRRKRSAAPTGSKATRATAQDVRGRASKLTDDAVAAAVRAKATASTAATGVRKTAATGVDATKDTARVAKGSAKRPRRPRVARQSEPARQRSGARPPIRRAPRPQRRRRPEPGAKQPRRPRPRSPRPRRPLPSPLPR